jgi:hypothetical protein
MFVVSGALALVGAIGSLALIRSRDFVASHGAPPAPETRVLDPAN